MTARTLVSVIVPTYNRASLILRALDSILAQTLQPLEVIVVDDGSTDGSAELLAPHADAGRIRYLRQDHRNAASARNLGIRHSHGRYLAFMDSDDEWHPDKLAKQLVILERAPASLGVVYCDMLRVTADGSRVHLRAPRIVRGRTFDPQTLDYQYVGIGIQASVFRRECLTGANRFDDQLCALCDLDLFVRLSRDYAFHHLEEPLVDYHAMPGVSTNRGAIAAARERMLYKYREAFPDDPRYLASQCARISAARYLCGESRLAAVWGMKALRLAPLSPKACYRALPAVLRLGALAPLFRRYESFTTTSGAPGEKSSG